MAIPVPIPAGALPVVDADTARAEALVAKVTQIIANGTSGGTLAIRTPNTIISDSLNPIIDPATGLPKISSLQLDTPELQLFYRQFALAMAQVVPGWLAGTSGILADLIINEIPVGAINSVNKSYNTANLFRASSTMFYLNGQRLLIGVDYTETVARTGILVSAAFPAPRSGDNIVIDYVKSLT